MFTNQSIFTMNRQEAKDYIDSVCDGHTELLQHVGADNNTNAKRKIDKERRSFERIKAQLRKVVDALEADNWSNAVIVAERLLGQLTRTNLPTWLNSIPPNWIGKVTPTSYRRWNSFCKEQFLVALADLQNDAELGLEVDIEANIEEMRISYLSDGPAIFVEKVGRFCTGDFEEKEDNEVLGTTEFEVRLALERVTNIDYGTVSEYPKEDVIK